jgi:hypothetical protein
LYPNGIVAANVGDVPAAETKPVEPPVKKEETQLPQEQTEQNRAIEDTKEPESVSEKVAVKEESVSYASSSALIATAAESVEGGSVWWTGAGVVSLLGAIGVAFARRTRKEEWDVEEIT